MTLLVDNWKVFARETIRINDLDPTYEMLHAARGHYGDDWVARYCLHMLLFYNVREAERAAYFSTSEFWDYVADNFSTCKRGTERRHFRGPGAVSAISTLRDRFPDAPSGALRAFYRPTYPELYRAIAGTVPEFGPYFIWKWADYLQCVFGLPIDLSEAHKYLPSEPAKCCKALWPELTLKQGLDRVVDEIGQYTDPFTATRSCGISEAETILCMLKGYFITKSHRIGDDLAEKHRLLEGSPLKQYLPPEQGLSQWERGTL